MNGKRAYTEQHARAGVDADLPSIDVWENQYPGYEIEIEMPEFTSVCPKTGLPDHGTIRISYMPDRWCLELKSLKMYMIAYRSLGIFQENAVNRFLRDIVAAAKPVSATVTGEFAPRGGVFTRITASWSKKRGHR
jgi:7-cyano-7-deazaguanine reductase